MMIEKQCSSASTSSDRASHYLSLLEEHEQRGGSLRSFAAARGLSVWTLYGWRRRLGLTRRRMTTPPGSLVAVDLVHEAPATSAPESEKLEVVLTDGLRVRLPRDISAERLGEVVTVLRSC